MDKGTGPTVSTRPAALGVLAVLLACAAWWGGLSPALHPPAVAPATAPATDFSAARAREHLRIVTRQPRPVGSHGHAQTRQYLIDALRELGLEPRVQATTALRGSHRVIHSRVQNIVARMPGTGTGTGPAVVLTAHYDSVPHSPGANDAGNGLAAVLETVRALRAGPALDNDVIVLFTDAEEIGLMGATGYVQDHPWADDTGVVLSAEGRGNAGPVYMFRTVGGNGELVRTLAQAAPWARADSVSDEVFRHMPNDTDLSVFRDAGHLGMDFANVRGFNHYHTVLDSFELADPRTLQHHGDYLLAMARAFGNQDLSNLHAPRRVYFGVPLAGLVHYPTGWAVPLAVVATLLLAWLAVSMFRSGAWRPGGTGVGLAHFVAALAALPLLTGLAWAVVGRGIPELAWFNHGAPYEGHRYLLGLALLAGAAYAASLNWLRGRVRPAELLAGPLPVFALLALASAALAPGASYLFLWPLLAAMAGLALARRPALQGPGATAVVLALAAIPALYFLTPMIAGMEESMTMDGLSGAIALAALLLGLLAPQIDFATRPTGPWLPVLLAIAGAGVLAAALLDAGFSEQRKKPQTLEYIADADRGEAFWVSVDPEPDEWTRQYLGVDPARGPLPDWAPGPARNAGQPWFRPASILRDDAPGIRLLEDSQEAGQRHLRLQVTSPVDAYATVIGFPEGQPAGNLRIDGSHAPGGSDAAHVQVTSYAPGDSPVELAFTVPAGAPLQLLLRTTITGLPPPAGGPPPARPPQTMPMGPRTVRTRLQRTVEL